MALATVTMRVGEVFIYFPLVNGWPKIGSHFNSGLNKPPPPPLPGLVQKLTEGN